MKPINFLSEVRKLKKDLPSFPDGRIDYHKAKTSAAVLAFLEYNGKLLIVKRSNKVATYKGLWSVIAGYMDEIVSPKRKILQEIREETGLLSKDIRSIRLAKPFIYKDKKGGFLIIMQPAHVILKRVPRIRMDWENTSAKWVDKASIWNFNLVPNVKPSFDALRLGDRNNNRK